MLSLKVDISEPLAGIEQMLGEDLPFTIARFLTMEAQSGQAAVKEKLPDGRGPIFQTRNDWTRQGIKITPATKETQMSEVFTDTSNWKSGAPDYLPRQEEGGERVPVAGHRFLAIPTRYLFRYTPQNRPIPDNLRPSALLPPGINLGEVAQGSFARGSRATGTHRVIGRATMRKLGNGEFAAFVQQTKGGTLCVFVRHGGMGYKGERDAEPWYTLVREAHIKPRFPMEELVEAAVDRDLEKNFDRAAAEVLVNRALKSGFRVQF